jgi:hypothetical protein
MKIMIFLSFLVSKNLMANKIFMGMVMTPFLACEERRTVWKCIRHEGLDPNAEVDSDHIIFLQNEREAMRLCIIEANTVVEDIIASKYRNIDYGETLDKLLTETKNVCEDLKNKQSKEWNDYLNWQDDPHRKGPSGKRFDVIRDAAVSRWHQYQNYILEGERRVEQWVSLIEKNEECESERAFHSAEYYVDLLHYAKDRMKKIDQILSKIEEDF